MTGCFSGASPGMKVLKITSEQYYNDAVRYLKDRQFVFDSSKIRTVLKNLEENPPTGKDETKSRIELMVIYLNILKEYSEIFQRGKIPADRDISRIIDMFDPGDTDRNSIFLRLFMYYIKSFTKNGLDRSDKVSLISCGNYLRSDKDFLFPFYFGGIPVDSDFADYIYSTALLQNRFVLPVFSDIRKNTGRKPEPVELILSGEAYFRVGDYDNALRFLKYFRLPTFSEHVFTDYALSMLVEVYKQKDMKVDMNVAEEKMTNRMRLRFERIFPYLSEPDAALYSFVVSPDTEELEVAEDMLDLSEHRPQEYIKADFSNMQIYELTQVYKTFRDIDTYEVRTPLLYQIYSQLGKENEIFPVFTENRLVILGKEENAEYFV
ncbi:MAG: hypothetical protein ACOCWO_03130, partial [Candidatus Muiribacteriaceae bacterium]